MHLRVHGCRVTMASIRANITSVVIWPPVIITSRDHLTPFYQNRAQRECHRAVCGYFATLEQVELILAHFGMVNLMKITMHMHQ
jgi:hypothetical protein